jgi:sigma-54 dependent transcriptional regulator, acetoin dehydrogenase operon transcriptional activator AcoR
MTSSDTDPRELASARLRFLTAEPAPAGAVRRPILASWTRSRQHGVAADAVRVPYQPDPDADTPLTRCAEPVLQRLAERLDGRAVSIILTDHDGLVLSRRTSDRAFEARLDRVLLAPGFSYAERHAGTNGIGTALEVGAATAVLGHEHYAENLEMFSCAAAPIRDARTGRIAGAMNLTCTHSDADDLLLTLAESTAEQIEQALAATASRRELAVLDAYRRACRRGGGQPVVAVSADTLILNAAARSLLDAADQSALLAGAVPAGDQRQLLPSGRWALVRSRPVLVDDAEAGTVLRVELAAEPEPVAAAPAPRAAVSGVVGSSAVWLGVQARVAELVAAGRWVALAGEAGTGKVALLQGVVRTRGRRALVLDAATDELPEAGEAGAAVVLRHVDGCDRARLRDVERWLAALDAERTWVGLTVGADHDPKRLAAVLSLVSAVVEVPPLRMHLDDVPALVDHFLGLFGHGVRPTCGPDAQRALLHAPWPGNIAQLRGVVLDTLQRRPRGVLTAADLPPEVHATSRRVLTPLESLERDAIARALLEAGGDKRAAAKALGISRATVYRKVRQYGIQSPA